MRAVVMTCHVIVPHPYLHVRTNQKLTNLRDELRLTSQILFNLPKHDNNYECYNICGRHHWC